MRKLIEKHQQKNGRGRGVIQFSPEALQYVQSKINFIPGMNTADNTSVQQANQQARKEVKVNTDNPKTRAEGSYRNIERRRRTGITKDQEDTERDIRNATQSTWRTNAANFFGTLGNAALADAGIMSFIANPLPTLASLTGGAVGGRVVDNQMEKQTGKSWGEWINNKLGFSQGSMLGHLTNPGYFIGGAAGAKGLNAVDYAIRMDMPRFGYAPTTNYYFKPGYAGMNGGAVEKRYNPVGKPVELTVQKIKSGQFTRKDAEQFLEKSKQVDDLFKNIAKFGNAVSEPKILRTLLNKMKDGTKGKAGTNTEINKVKAEEFAKTPEGQLQTIRNRLIVNKDTGEKETIWDRLTKSAKGTGIDWRDDPIDNQQSYLVGMDTDLKLKPVGFDNKTPFIQRYYDNVIEHILDGGFQQKILDSGDLIKDPLTEQWQGKWPDGTWNRVIHPEEYIKARYAQEKGAEIELPKPIIEDGVIYDGVPMHGAGLGENGPISKQGNNWIEYLRKPSTAPGKNGYWTVIRDKAATESYAPSHYQQENYSVPFYKMPKYEEEPFKPGNSYGLMNLMRGSYSGKIMQPRGVQDGVPGPINEYNFGPTFDYNPKSLWNTLDFEPGAGPMAYNKQEKQEKFYV